MSEASETNKRTIEEVYGAFRRGDVDFILQRVSDETRWDFSVASSDVPWHAPVHKKQELPRFFQAMAEHVDFEAFEPRAFVTSAHDVVVKLRVAYKVKRTGRRVDEEQVQWWSFDDAGRVASLRHFEDTAMVKSAWQ